MKHSVGENVRILRVAALDGGMATLDGRRGRRRQCCGREALRDNEGEGTRCKETKPSVDVNVRIVRLASLDGGRGRRHRCCEREALRDKEGEVTRCKETKHYVGENVIIMRRAALDGGRVLHR